MRLAGGGVSDRHYFPRIWTVCVAGVAEFLDGGTPRNPAWQEGVPVEAHPMPGNAGRFRRTNWPPRAMPLRSAGVSTRRWPQATHWQRRWSARRSRFQRSLSLAVMHQRVEPALGPRAELKPCEERANLLRCNKDAGQVRFNRFSAHFACAPVHRQACTAIPGRAQARCHFSPIELGAHDARARGAVT